MKAVRYGCSDEILTLLVRSGAWVDQPERCGLTPLLAVVHCTGRQSLHQQSFGFGPGPGPAPSLGPGVLGDLLADAPGQRPLAQLHLQTQPWRAASTAAAAGLSEQLWLPQGAAAGTVEFATGGGAGTPEHVLPGLSEEQCMHMAAALLRCGAHAFQRDGSGREAAELAEQLGRPRLAALLKHWHSLEARRLLWSLWRRGDAGESTNEALLVPSNLRSLVCSFLAPPWMEVFSTGGSQRAAAGAAASGKPPRI